MPLRLNLAFSMSHIAAPAYWVSTAPVAGSLPTPLPQVSSVSVKTWPVRSLSVRMLPRVGSRISKAPALPVVPICTVPE
jgi:hypothetical protein